MKNWSALLMLCSFLFVACSGHKMLNQELIGTWKLEIDSFSDDDNTIPQGLKDYTTEFGNSITYVFQDDNSYTITSASIVNGKRGTYVVNNQNNEITLRMSEEDPNVIKVNEIIADTLYCESLITSSGKMIFKLKRVKN